MNCSVVIPVYCGEQTLDPLIERLAKVLPNIAESYEVVLVNDGSPDNSWAVIERLAAQYAWVRGINLMRNYGQHNATLCGVRAARHEVIITMDDDLQHPPEEIHRLLAKLNEGYDVVYGVPRQLPQGFLRNEMTKYTKIVLANVMGISSVRNMSAFRAFRTNLRGAFAEFRSPNTILDVLLSWGTSRITAVVVDIRPANGSNYNFASLVKATLLVLTGYSTGPLRLASLVGFIMTLFGLAIFIYVLIIYFTAGSLPGFPFLASIISLFSGAQLFTLGIIGEYLAYMFDRSMGHPAYVVQEMIGGTKS
ncbi:MAG: glycosyltransferase family 2 protein [Anaerolineales bacterium]|nr:glycosyltransferase family 2 protein [Anaerolineales bacterium]